MKLYCGIQKSQGELMLLDYIEIREGMRCGRGGGEFYSFRGEEEASPAAKLQGRKRFKRKLIENSAVMI